MHIVSLVALVTLTITACATTGPAPTAQLKLYVFDCGSIELDDISDFGLSNEETSVRELFVPCYLIVHGSDRLLWDAGLPLNLAGASRPAKHATAAENGAASVHPRTSPRARRFSRNFRKFPKLCQFWNSLIR